MMLRSLAVGAVLVASAEAFAPGAMGLRMSVEPAQVNRKQALQSAGAIAAGVLAAPSLAGAAALDPNTGFPTGSCLPSAQDAASGCSPMTNAASVLDKQKAVLAGKITVATTKCDVLTTAVSAMKVLLVPSPRCRSRTVSLSPLPNCNRPVSRWHVSWPSESP